MDILFDPNNEEDRLRKKIEDYYGSFSDDVRKKLFSKNIDRPSSVYDLLYPQTRESLLSKNVELNINIDDTGKEIRDLLLAKNSLNKTDLLSSSEDIRKSYEARNKMSKDKNDILDQSEVIRKAAIARNKNDESDLLSNSEDIRRMLMSKNKTVNSDLSEDSEGLRDRLLAKNVDTEGDLLSKSDDIRKLNLSKGVDKETDLSKDSELHRKLNVQKNTDSTTDLEDASNLFRDNLISKNVTKEQIPLDDLFESARASLLSKGVSSGVDLLDFSDSLRDALVSKNVSNSQPIEEMFDKVRKGLISKNVPSDQGKLEDVAKSVRDGLVSKNVINSVSLEEFSQEIRNSLIAKNIEVKREDIVGIFDSVRNGLLSKNTSPDLDLLTLFNKERERLLSANNAKITNLESDSNSVRKNALGKNVGTISDIEGDSSSFRDNLTSKNVPSPTDIESDSSLFRDNLTSKNVPSSTDIESDSVTFRDGLTSKNVSNETDIETDSVVFRDNLESKNVPNKTDIESDSVSFRDNLESKNVPKETDIETDSVAFRDNLESKNVPKETDIETDSVAFRDNLESKNVSNETDIETDSIIFRDNLESKNIPNDSDIEIDSEAFRENLESKNIPNDSDLLSDSEGAYGLNITKNVSSSSNLLVDSEDFRDGLISANVDGSTDLLSNSQASRDLAMSKNSGGLIGLNISAAGTSTFLGVSRVLTQGILFRAILLPRNKYRKNTNEYQDGTESLIHDSKNWEKYDQLQGMNAFDMDYSRDTSNGGALSLFGNGTRIPGTGFDEGVDGKFYGDKSTISHDEADQTLNSTLLGSVTDAIRNLNISRNNYFIGKFGKGNDNKNNGFQAYDYLNGLSLSLRPDSRGNALKDKFQDLIQKSVGGLSSPQDFKSIPTMDKDDLADDTKTYIADITTPVFGSIDVNPEQLAAQQIAGNPFDDTDFRNGTKGVKRVINLIKNSNLDFAQNYNPQNESAYITGLKDGNSGEKRIGRQRFTIANPYAPKKAKKLTFMLENYSNGQKLYLPPYITSYQHASNANWNEINFLGRPEPLYTYNNSNRTGSISFFVLSDFATTVDMGIDQESQEMITETFPRGFTQVSDSSTLETEIKKIDVEIKEIKQQLVLLENQGEKASLQRNVSELQSVREKLKKDKAAVDINKASRIDGDPNYSESNRLSANIYRPLINDGYDGNDTVGKVLKTQDTQTRINDMKKGLMFQPSFFSGDQMDFTKRIEFIEKMVRPSRNRVTKKVVDVDGNPVLTEKGTNKTITTDGPGFSFINPPVCHMHLGDWFNHDIIIDSIDYDYTDATWSLGGGERVQPMWTQVTMSFKIIGRYKNNNGDALSSTDRGGFFSL